MEQEQRRSCNCWEQQHCSLMGPVPVQRHSWKEQEQVMRKSYSWMKRLQSYSWKVQARQRSRN